MALLQGLFVSLELSERQELLRGVATHEGVVGGVGAMAASIADGLTRVDADALAAHLLKAHAARQPSALGARRALGRDEPGRARGGGQGRRRAHRRLRPGGRAELRRDGRRDPDRRPVARRPARSIWRRWRRRSARRPSAVSAEALEALSREVRWREAQRRVHAQQQQQQQPAPRGGARRVRVGAARRRGRPPPPPLPPRPPGPDALPQADARGVLLPLVKALDARCAAQEETIAQLRRGARSEGGGARRRDAQRLI